MKYNDVSNLSGIVNECDFLLGTDTTSYPLTQKTRNANRWLDRALSLILQADAKWEFDCDNKTDLPIATTAMISGQRDYSFSGAGFLKILKVECKDQGGNWIPLRQVDKGRSKNEVLDDLSETGGVPHWFDLRANSVFLYPKPSYASAGGLKIFYQRVMDYFAHTDTTKEPGFAEPFHRLISYGMAHDYAIANDMRGKISMLSNEITKLEQGLVEHYAERNKDLKIKLTINKENYSAGEDWPRSVGWVS
jgi:hypothetical protein